MIQCKDCQYGQVDAFGNVRMTCNPFENIVEPECLAKWQLVKIDTMVQAYQATVRMYERLAPMQEKMLRHMEREIDEADEADAWKREYEDEDEEGL